MSESCLKPVSLKRLDSKRFKEVNVLIALAYNFIGSFEVWFCALVGTRIDQYLYQHYETLMYVHLNMPVAPFDGPVI